MAKSFASVNQNKYPYPSLYGSHRSMMIDPESVIKELTDKIAKIEEKDKKEKKEEQELAECKKRLSILPSMAKSRKDGNCICSDEHGDYETEIIKLDNHLADPNRYRESRLGKLFSGNKKEEK